jgi:serine/threonine protein kinase
VVLDEFLVEAELGQGGFGVVYSVQSKTTGERFAVKRALLEHAAGRGNFLNELQTWINLSPHPHVVACRFFRTIGDEVAVFSELVNGGSLSAWIRDGKLYEGGEGKALERILDIAVQAAWGLHGIHEQGLVHLDVKPDNILLTADAMVKVSDFGLAAARASAGPATMGGSGQSAAFGVVGGTPAYLSPEQAQGMIQISEGAPVERVKLTRQADVWGWGVSVLEMFNGGRTWLAGQAADSVLERLVQTGPERRGVPPMPEGVAAVLRTALRRVPEERWRTLANASEALAGVYARQTGKSYPRRIPARRSRADISPFAHDRRTKSGVTWEDPLTYLAAALGADGKEAAAVESLERPQPATRQALAIRDLALYDEARNIYERLVQHGRAHLLPELAKLCGDKALIHGFLDDTPGAIALSDRAVEIWERLVNQEGRREFADQLANAYVRMAGTTGNLGNTPATVALYSRAIAIWERLLKDGWRDELANGLAVAYYSKASAVGDLGDKSAAGALCDQAIAIWERLVKQEGRSDLARRLARAYCSKAGAVRDLGDKFAAAALSDQAIEILEHLPMHEAHHDLSNQLARAYSIKAGAAGDLGEKGAATELYARAIEIWERLVNQEGRNELVDHLATAYMNKAVAAGALGDNRSAATLSDQVIEIWERLVKEAGRRDLASALATAYMNKGVFVGALGDTRGKVALSDQAIEIWERLVRQEGRREHATRLAEAYVIKGLAQSEIGATSQAVEFYDRAIEIWEWLVKHEGRSDLAEQPARAYMVKAVAVGDLGDKGKAVALADQAIEILERLVKQEGRRDLANELRRARMVKALWQSPD